MIWHARRKSIDVSQGGIVMGILNVTLDSFSDGGRYSDLSIAVEHALSMERQGAQIIDIGGESTRPGAPDVSPDAELERVIPVLRALRDRTDALISVDTRKTEVAKQVLECGADIINDVEGLSDGGMATLCADAGCGVVIMHKKGTLQDMQVAPSYEDVVSEVREFFQERYESVTKEGIRDEQICWDPGIGFGKTLAHNLSLIARLNDLRVARRPILLALSRKKTLSTILGDVTAGRSPLSTAVMTAYGHQRGAQLHRVHDVSECVQALKLVKAVECYE